MEEEGALSLARIRTPRAAAIAGIIFSVLLIIIMILVGISVPRNPLDAGNWLASDGEIVALAMNLLPFAGIAFLWFVGVLRDRIGAKEDRFFATVFLGSGLVFMGMLFIAAAVSGAIIMSYGANPKEFMESGIYTFGRTVAYQITNVYALKMAGVFTISTSTLAIRTKIFPRWMAITGYIVAALLLFTLGYLPWVPFLFPAWVLMISVYILVSNLKSIQDVSVKASSNQSEK